MCRVPDFHQQLPRGPETWNHARQAASLATATTSSTVDRAHAWKEGTGTSTNCSTTCGSRSTARRGIPSWGACLGTSITARQVVTLFEVLWEAHQLVHRLRLRNIEQRHGHKGLDKGLHGVPLNRSCGPPAAPPDTGAAILQRRRRTNRRTLEAMVKLRSPLSRRKM